MSKSARSVTAVFVSIIFLLPLALILGWLGASVLIGLVQPSLVVVGTPICAVLILRWMNRSMREVLGLD